MNKVTQSRSELEILLSEQIGFLITSCALYDKGQHAEAKRLANTLRILFHETKKSKSLLGQLNFRDISWEDTADPIDPDNLACSFGLFSIQFDAPTGRVPWLAPKGNPMGGLKISNFQEWWLKPVVMANTNYNRLSFSRKKIILNVANTHGGSHVDPGLEEDYMKISKSNALGIVAVRGVERILLQNPELPSLRQIAHEVLLTLHEKVPIYFTSLYQYDDIKNPYRDTKINKMHAEPYSIEITISQRS